MVNKSTIQATKKQLSLLQRECVGTTLHDEELRVLLVNIFRHYKDPFKKNATV